MHGVKMCKKNVRIMAWLVKMSLVAGHMWAPPQSSEQPAALLAATAAATNHPALSSIVVVVIEDFKEIRITQALLD